MTMEKNVACCGVKIRDDFWSPKLDTFFNITLKDTFEKFERDDTLENYRNLIEGKLGTHKNKPWYDGLLLETIRGAADYLTARPSPEMEARIDGYIEIIEETQLAVGGGYISTYTQLQCPDRRYGENGGSIIIQHDLYNNGCLFEAGVHYYLATGKDRLLKCALRSANELAGLIGEPPKKWIVPGHSLPEYALLELVDLLKSHPELSKIDVPFDAEEYLRLAKFWVHGRGHHEHRTNNPQYLGEYAQDHAPVELQFQAVGHAVRATLYYTGVTRLAIELNDEALLQHSLRLWDNVELRKMHINGGVGASHFEEKFGCDYDLTNGAYLETCATVGLIFWAEALSRATGDARYYQTIERCLYNLMLSSVSLQGDAYFYQNPLQSDGTAHHWAWHSCPCCPPMIHKTFGMLDRMVCAQDDEGIFVNLFIGGEIETQIGGAPVRLSAHTELPWKGSYSIRVESAEKPFALRIRVPQWATDLSFRLNGAQISPEILNGYASLIVKEGDEISLVDSLPAVRMEAHPYVRDDRGRVAIMRGPLVYCVEGVDNSGEVNFELPENPEMNVEYRKDFLGGVSVIRGKRSDDREFVAVPLYAWDNRMAGKMKVWLQQSGKPDTWSTDGWTKKLYRKYMPVK